jgi:hypothetical protein
LTLRNLDLKWIFFNPMITGLGNFWTLVHFFEDGWNLSLLKVGQMKGSKFDEKIWKKCFLIQYCLCFKEKLFNAPGLWAKDLQNFAWSFKPSIGNVLTLRFMGRGVRNLWQNLTLQKAFVGFCVTKQGEGVKKAKNLRYVIVELLFQIFQEKSRNHNFPDSPTNDIS